MSDCLMKLARFVEAILIGSLKKIGDESSQEGVVSLGAERQLSLSTGALKPSRQQSHHGNYVGEGCTLHRAHNPAEELCG